MLNKNGFTILEISIVLAILALIIGGIISGQSLIRSSEIQAVTGEAARYTQAISQFRDKYNALPGDMGTAHNLWLTNSGNGDGWIYGHSTDDSAEIYYVWHHLVLAGMVEGNYTGLSGPITDSDKIPGENIPSSRLSNAGWATHGCRDVGDCISYRPSGDIPPKHMLWLGGRPIAMEMAMVPVLVDVEAYDIDKKIDDGIPNSGNVLAQDNQSGPECGISTDYMATAANAGLLTCSLMFKMGF